MPNKKSKLNEVADAMDADAKKPQPEPKHEPQDDSCPMCGAMSKHMDPEKLAQFMKSNPLK